jgi:glutamate racemase
VQPIGIFDSGIGGLTVYREIRAILPDNPIIYLGDTARLPYGTKSPATVTAYAMAAARFLLKYQVSMVVVACNTASALALDSLKEKLSVPVVGVVEPGARAVAEASTGGKIGVIGTKSTIASGAYLRAIKRFRPEARVTAADCPLFVSLVEEGWLTGEVPRLTAQRYLAPLLENEVDTILLGCTHYPLLREVIAEVAGEGISLIDSAKATAQEVRRIADPADGGESRFFATDLSEHFTKVACLFLGEESDKFELVDL